MAISNMSHDAQELTVSCTRCTSNVLISHTTYDPSGRNLICFNCYNKLAKGEQPYKVVQTAVPSDRTNYRCFNCNYKFSRLNTFQFTGICFNCGKRTVEIEETKQIIEKDRKTLLDY